ncbi:MAG: tetratricopeptide repeat protein [Pseudomonadota bacterium]
MRGQYVVVVALTALSACNTIPGERIDPAYQGLEPPAGTAVLRDAVDGMIVGDRLMEAGEYELALRAYYRAAAENGTDAVALMAIGSASLALGRLGQAEDTLRAAVELAPDEPVAWNNLGVVLMEQGNYGEARQIFQRAFALDSGQSDSIRENLRLAIARMENSAYTPTEQNENRYDLERRGGGRYILTGS